MKDRVTEYYNECYTYFKIGWHSHKNLCLHYGYYDDGHGHDKALLRMIEILAQEAQITAKDRVLDAGCGLGGSSIWLAQNIGCRVVGIDINPSFVRIAKNEAAKRGLSELVSFYEMDFRGTEFGSGSFDVVWALESSCYARDKWSFLMEMCRLLKPGGRIVIADGYCAQKGMGVDNVLKGWAVPNMPTIAEFGEYMKAAGFNKITCLDISRRIAQSSLHIYRLAQLTYPIALLLKLSRLKTGLTLAHVQTALRQYRYGTSGLIKYCIFTAVKE